MPPQRNRRRNKQKGKDKLRGRAVRDVRISMQDYLDELERARGQTQRRETEDVARTGAVYGALQQQLAPLAAQYQGQAQGIMGDLQGRLGAAGQGVGTGTPSSAGALLGAIGQGALGEIGSQQTRNLGYLSSVQSQGAVEGTQRQAGIRRQAGEQLADLRQRRLQTMQQAPTLTRARMDELRDIRSRNQLALAKLALERQGQGFQQGLAQQELAGQQAIWNILSRPEILRQLLGGG